MQRPPYGVRELCWDFGLNEDFFWINHDKSKKWFLEAQKLILELKEFNTGLVALTGAGKTVIALLVAIMSGRRTLFLVPNKSLAYENEKLYLMMKFGYNSGVITGVLPFQHRDWSDQDDRIIFATGEVVMSEIMSGNLNLAEFDLVVLDEMHHASSENYVYSKIAQLCGEQDPEVRILGLSASPVNKVEQIPALWKNCNLHKIVKIDVPSPELSVSIVFPEYATSFNLPQRKFGEDLILSQMMYCLTKMNEILSAMSLGKALSFDPQKMFKRTDLSKLKTELDGIGALQIHSDGDVRASKQVSSFLAEYSAWAHIYNLFLSESYLAIRQYVFNKLDKSNAYFAKRMRKFGKIYLLSGLMEQELHPKSEMVRTVLESVTSRGKQAIVFVGTKASGIALFKELEQTNIRTDIAYGQMNRHVVEHAIARMKSKDIDCLITTVLGEGHNLSADVVINATPATYPIRKIQNDGRTGRFGNVGEVINIVAQHERYLIPSIARRAKQLTTMDYSTGKLPKLPKRSQPNPSQKLLF